MDMVRTGKITDFSNVDLESFHSLIVQNMNLMKTAVADSSTNNEIPVEASGASKKLTPLNYNRMIIGQNGYPVTSELEGTVNDEDEECFLVELGENNSPEMIDLESESEEEDCLLVELADRISEKHTPPATPTMNEVFEEEEGFVHPGLVTSYEKDDDYTAKKSNNDGVNCSCIFTTEQDIQLIEVLKDYPELWFPKESRTSLQTMDILWKQINKRMPKGLNNRDRWRTIKRGYKRSLRKGNLMPYQYAEQLEFLISRNKNVSKLGIDENKKGSKIEEHKISTRKNEKLKEDKDYKDDKEKHNQCKKMQVKSKSFIETKPQSIDAKLNRTAGDHKYENPFQDHNFIVKMIRIIEKHPKLWHPNSDLILRRLPQPKTWAEVHKEINNRNYSVHDIKLKWKTLRACYTKNTVSSEPFRKLLHFLNFKKEV